MSDSIYDIALRQSGRATAAARGLASPEVTNILEEQESPGVFEQFFRFAGRPMFVVNNLITGDLKGAGLNAAQFLNEAFTLAGAFNSGATATGLLSKFGVDLPNDFTSREDRPEFTDVLGRWGVLNPQYLGSVERLGLDIAGGLITDPLGLIGGGAKGLARGSLSGLSRKSAQRVAWYGLQHGGGPEIRRLLSETTNEVIQDWAVRRAARGGRAARLGTLLGQFNADTLPDLVKNAANYGLDQKTASQIVLGIQGRAAERLFFKNAADAGVDLTRAVRTLDTPGDRAAELKQFLDPNTPKTVFTQPISEPVDFALAQGRADSIFARRQILEWDPIAGAARQVNLWFRPRHTGRADVIEELNQKLLAFQASPTAGPRLPGFGADEAAIHYELGALHGYTDDAIRAFLTDGLSQRGFQPNQIAQVLDDPATGIFSKAKLRDYARFLDEIPSQVLDEGINALRAKGMLNRDVSYYVPLIGWRDVDWTTIFKSFTFLGVPEWTAAAGRRVGDMIGGPLGLKLARGAETLENRAGQVGEWTKASWGWAKNRLYSRFSPTDGVAPEAEKIAQEIVWRSHREVNKHGDETLRTFVNKFDENERFHFMNWIDLASDEFRKRADEIRSKISQGAPLDQNALRTLATLPNVNSPVLQRAKDQAESVLRDLAGRGQFTPTGRYTDEINALVAGTKPQILLDASEYVSLMPNLRATLDTEVAAGRLVRRDFGSRMIFHAPNEAGRAGQLQRLIQNPNAYDPDYHLSVGRALGYADTAIYDFLRNTGNDLNFFNGDGRLQVIFREQAEKAIKKDTVGLTDADSLETYFKIQERLIAGDLMNEIRDNMIRMVGPARAADVEQAVKTWQRGMEQIPPYMRYVAKYESDLVNLNPAARSAWENATGNPFYVPHQVTRRVWEALDEGILDNLKRSKINDVFSRAREHKTTAAFRERLEGLADELGLEYDDATDLQNLDMAELYFRRMASFEMTKARQELWQRMARTLERNAGRAEDYRFYINRVLRPTARLDPKTGNAISGSGRENLIGKLLGGGPLEIPFTQKDRADGMEKFLTGIGIKGVKTKRVGEGRWGVQFYFAGVNSIWKPLLTSHPVNVKFRMRNLFASVFMAPFADSRIDADAVWKAVRNDGMVRVLLKTWNPKKAFYEGDLAALARPPGEMQNLLSKGDYLTVAVRHLTGTTVAERDAALEVLKRSGMTVGPYSWAQVSDAMKLVLGGTPIGPADLSSGYDLLQKLIPDVGAINPRNPDLNLLGRVVEGFRKYVAWGERINNDLETSIRVTAMLGSLAKGMDPADAAAKINKAFVDYTRQSMVERAIRDTFPFARFMIGSQGWVKDILSKPSVFGGGGAVNIQTLGLMQRSMSQSLSDEPGGGQFLPGEAAQTLAMPIPWRDREGNLQFLTSIGLPHETSLAILSAAMNDESLKRNVLGSMHPLLRVPVEYLGGRSYYFGSEFGSYRKAPFGEYNPFAEVIPGRDGRPDRYEVNGVANELMNMLPTAGVQSVVDKLVDSRRTWWNKLLVTTTGFRISSVDLERELKRRVAAYLEDKVSSGQIGEVQAFFVRQDPENVPEDLKILLQALANERAAARKRASAERGR